ncbi:recombinase family protein [Nonomuraea sp. NPDC052129]|uniref:recombinase family protein n=1 Tax=Nonomuraea sp. NPDC052129 TaxID=3154651 RepID=UPI0034449CFF
MHDLEQAGVALFAADEPITLNGKRADKVPHPVPAKAAEGKHKTRLIPDPIKGPIVTQIYTWRVTEHLGYGDIVDRLNADLDRYPPGQSLNPNYRGTPGWGRSAIVEILKNPKYTGYMVWNRKATTSRKGKGRGTNNPPSAWVWSDYPTHEPLVTCEMYDAAQGVGRQRARSRVGSTVNKHPQTKRTYVLRSFVVCEICGTRMYGKCDLRHAAKTVYMSCQPGQNRKNRAVPEGHRTGIRVREDHLLTAVHDLFARRVFGPHRRELLAVELPKTDQRALTDWKATRGAVSRTLTELGLRIDRLTRQFEETDLNPVLAQKLNVRFIELQSDHRARSDRLAELDANPPEPDHAEDLIDRLPILTGNLAHAPEELQRELFEVFKLEIRYDARTNLATIRVTLDSDTIGHLMTVSRKVVSELSPSGRPVTCTVSVGSRPPGASATDRLPTHRGEASRANRPQQDENGPPLPRKAKSARYADLMSAPCRIRTYAPGSGDPFTIKHLPAHSSRNGKGGTCVARDTSKSASGTATDGL